MEFISLTSWQLILEGNKIELLIIGLDSKHSTDEISSSLEKVLSNEGVSGIEVSVKQVQNISKSPSGKTPLIKNLNLKK